MNIEEIRQHLLTPDHVQTVHDLQVWTVTSGLPALAAHVVVDETCFNDGHVPQFPDQLQDCITGHFDVEHSTFQLESAAHSARESGRH
jgi:cobalt-zinc-cadmium efflux system protein